MLYTNIDPPNRVFRRWQRLKLHQTKGTPFGKKHLAKNGDTTIVLTVLVSIFIIGILLVNLALEPPPEEKFDVIYLLDANKETDSFPKTVVIGENNTFTLWVGVENQRDETRNYSVLVKIDDGTAPVGSTDFDATETFTKTLANEELWEFQTTLTIDQMGHNRILFELWFLNATSSNLEYTGNWVNLSVEAS